MPLQISKLLTAAAANVKTLGQRLSVQASATHDPSDRADLNEWIEDCNAQAQALTAIAAAYAPIIQSAIETGCAGKTHTVQVHAFDPQRKLWDVVSTHEFTVEAVVVQ